MFRSLHMKLVLIMLLLITSLMTIVGAFLMTSITGFYIDQFYQQMDSIFGASNSTFYQALCNEAAQDDATEQLLNMLMRTKTNADFVDNVILHMKALEKQGFKYTGR